MAKRTSHFSKVLLSLLMAVPSFLSLIRKFTSLIEREARLAGRSFIILIVLAVLLGVISISIWVCVLLMIFFHFLALHWSIQSSLFMLIILNFIFMILIMLTMKKFNKNLTFPKTRRRFRDLSD